MTLQKRFHLALLALFIPVMLFLYIVLDISLQNNVYHSAVNSLQKLSIEAQIYTINYVEREQQGKPDVTLQKGAPLIASYLSKRMGVRVQLINAHHLVLADTERGALSYVNQDMEQAMLGNKSYMIQKASPSPLLLFSSPIYVDNQVIGLIRFLQPLEEEAQLLKRMKVTFAVACLLILAAAVLIANRFAKSLSKPIEQLRDMAKKLANGHYGSRIELSGYEEISQLAHSLHAMADAIELHIKQLSREKDKQRDFLDRVTHELKTPLTAIMGYSNLIPRLKDPKDVQESLRHISVESERMLTLVEELLSQSKYGDSPFSVSPTICDIAAIAGEAVYIMQPRLDKFQIRLHNELVTTMVVADPDKTKQIFLNLLDNAIKYSDASELVIQQTSSDDAERITIRDDGIGISHSLIARFDSSSSDTALTSDAGNGFGLLICKQLMALQGGEMSIQSKDGIGTTITLQFRSPAALDTHPLPTCSK
ncbi:HAMP domain-containing histidine kinase [Paenibacillus thiaminolyticus]|uniref:sensor histidine kinase n=1 Tax=Paenibacillus thiaminolyticus TaxID=49283 RepID=UPI001163C900|nr:HAMP domain-containing sensor histidine kinase [Paenibacillus thiaminolyticus]NGP57745.1 HAMP domain-containing histidine kinase [Paenibacillus thiaminolyticus]